MRKTSKLKISRAFCCNNEFNRKVICMKRSWDEVEALINKGNKCNKCKPKDC